MSNFYVTETATFLNQTFTVFVTRLYRVSLGSDTPLLFFKQERILKKALYKNCKGAYVLYFATTIYYTG